MNEFPSPDPPSKHPFWKRRLRVVLTLVIALALAVGIVATMPLLAAQGTGSQRAVSHGANQPDQSPTGTDAKPTPGQAQMTPTHVPPCRPVVANPVSSCLTCPSSTTFGAACPPCPTSVPERGLPCVATEPSMTATPPGKSPTISFCPGFPIPIMVGPGKIQVQGQVCGRGFHPGEQVNFLAIGGGKSMAWHVTADSNGNLVSQVPPLLCQLAPLTVAATGNEGSRSNTLSLSTRACQPTP